MSDSPERLPPLSRQIPIADEGIFYKPEPVFSVTSASMVPILILLFGCAVLLGYFSWVFFEGRMAIRHFIPVVVLFPLVLILGSYHAMRRIRFPHTADIYETGIWFTDYKLFVPYERLHSVELLYQGRRRFIRSSAVNIHVSGKEKSDLLKNIMLRIVNLPNKDPQILKLDLGTTETFMRPAADQVVKRLHQLACDRLSAENPVVPGLAVDPPLPLAHRIFSLIMP